MENAPAPVAETKPDRAAMLALAIPVAGSILLAVALVILGTRAATALSAGAFWGLAALGVLGFAVVMYGLRHLRGEDALGAGLSERNAQLDASKREAESILGAMPNGALIIDAEYRILVQYVRNLGGVLSIGGDSDDNFLALLRRLLPESAFELAHAYIAAFFDPAGRASGATASPMENVEVVVTTPSGAKQLRTLSFEVRPITDAGPDARALVWIEDTTDRVLRDRREREADAAKAKQFDLLAGLYHVDPAALDAFVREATEHLGSIDEALRAGDAPDAGQGAGFRQRLATILPHIDAIKASAASRSIAYFEDRAGAYHAKIAEIASSDALHGDDFLAIVMEQSAFRAELDDVQALQAGLAEPAPRVARPELNVAIPEPNVASPEPAPAAADDLVADVTSLANERARELGKLITVHSAGFDAKQLAPERREVVRDVLLALTRNALEHGIEDPALREASGKPPSGAIAIAASDAPTDGTFGFTFRDDGRGLDTAAIREKAVAAGLIDAEAAAALDESQLAVYMFSPALGNGLSRVKHRVVDDCGGSISVDSESGSFSEFSFELPG